MLIALLTGTVYFSWAITGISLSLSLSIFIFGLPIALLFILSIRGIAWLEGRMVEALLGTRMPRRSLPVPKNKKFMERLKVLLVDKHTWFSIIYMLFQLVLGVIYFTLLVTIFSLSVSGIGVFVLQEGFSIPYATNNNMSYYFPQWGYIPLLFAGLILWTGMMHFAKFVGRLHGRYARAMLISS